MLLDMGWYVRCTKGQTIPSLLTPQYLHSVRAPAAPAAAASATAALMGLKLGALSGSPEGSMADGLPGGEAAAGGGGGAAATSQSAAEAAATRGSSGGGGADPPTAEGSFKTNGKLSASASARSMAPDLASIYLEDREGEVTGSRRMRPESQVQQLQRERAAFDADLQGQQVVRLYQVLAPSLVGRGRVFGSKLALKHEWQALDVPYFDAPGEEIGWEWGWGVLAESMGWRAWVHSCRQESRGQSQSDSDGGLTHIPCDVSHWK